MKTVVIKLIKLYQQLFRVLFKMRPGGLFVYPDCKFEPTCSEYAIEAVLRYGALKGVAKSSKRIIRCGPWSHGGVDMP